MIQEIKNLCNRIRVASKDERPPLVRQLILEAMAVDGGGEEFKTTLAHIESSLGLLPILDDIRDDLRTERNPERIRILMATALKLRSQLKVVAR